MIHLYIKLTHLRLQKLLKINQVSGIENRAMILPKDDPFFSKPEIPNIQEIDAIFRVKGVSLAVTACRIALEEWGGSVSDITHTVAVTGTNFSIPGFDLPVVQYLGLSNTVDRTLLTGVGCSGGRLSSGPKGYCVSLFDGLRYSLNAI
jgi:type III polyketide synthase